MLTTHRQTPIHHDIIQRADNLQPSTKTKYIKEIDRLLAAGIDPRNREALAVYASTLSMSSRAFLKASLKLLFEEQVTNLKASATAGNVGTVQAALLNIEAMTDTIQVHREKGTKTHIWLSQSQVDQLTALPFQIHKDNPVRAMRDYIILAVLLGAGPRREEMSDLSFDNIKRLPMGTAYRDVLEITGKGNKTRPVPISPLLSKRLEDWKAITGGGNIARSINKAGKLGESLSVIGIFSIVREYGALIGLPTLDPHDCRRSFGRLGYEATHDIMLIKDLLGHADVKTTQTYIGLHLRLDVTASDFIIKSDEFFGRVSGD